MSDIRNRTPVKASVAFANFAFVKLKTASTSGATDGRDLRLSDHLLPYEGCVMSKVDFLWGAYGRDIDTAASLAEHEVPEGCATRAIQSRYQLDASSSGQSGRNDMVRTGFLHLDRVKAEFREELKEALKEQCSARQRAALERARPAIWPALAEEPGILNVLFQLEPQLKMIVHRVKSAWGNKPLLWVCTMRREPERMGEFYVPYLPEIEVAA